MAGLPKLLFAQVALGPMPYSQDTAAELPDSKGGTLPFAHHLPWMEQTGWQEGVEPERRALRQRS